MKIEATRTFATADDGSAVGLVRTPPPWQAFADGGDDPGAGDVGADWLAATGVPDEARAAQIARGAAATAERPGGALSVSDVWLDQTGAGFAS